MKIFNGKKWVTLGGGGTDGDGIYKIGGFTDTKIEIYDINDELIGEISRDVAQHSVLEAGEIHASNIVEVNNSHSIYVDSVNGSDVTGDGSSGNPYSSISQAIESLKKYLSKITNIYVKPGTYVEDVRLENFMGAPLAINLDSNTVINGRIIVYGCNNVYVYGNKGTLNHTFQSENAIYVRYSTFFFCDQLKIYGRAKANETPFSKRGFYITDGSTARVGDCVISGFLGVDASAIYTNYCSNVYAINNSGSNNTNSLFADRGSKIAGGGSTPQAQTIKQEGYGGQVIGTFTAKDEEGNIGGSGAITTYSKTYTSNMHKTWRVVDNWRNGVWMGNFTGKTGYNCYGLLGFNFASLRNDLSGKNIQSVTLTLQRKSEGGYDVNVNPRLYITTNAGTGTTAPALTKSYGELPSFTKGLQKTVTIPKTIITDILNNTSVKSLMLYQPDGKHYSIWEHNAVLTVTYQDQIKTMEDTPTVIPL